MFCNNCNAGPEHCDGTQLVGAIFHFKCRLCGDEFDAHLAFPPPAATTEVRCIEVLATRRDTTSTSQVRAAIVRLQLTSKTAVERAAIVRRIDSGETVSVGEYAPWRAEEVAKNLELDGLRADLISHK